MVKNNIKTEQGLFYWTPNFAAELPLHLQLVKIITRKLGSNGLGPGEYLPDIHIISEKSKVSKPIIRQCYDVLSSQNIVAKINSIESWVINHGPYKFNVPEDNL